MAFKCILLISVVISIGSTEDGNLTMEEVDTTMITDVVGRQHVDYKYPDGPNQKETVLKLFSDLKKDQLEAYVRKLSSFHSRNAIHYFGESEAEGWLISEIKRTLIDYKGGVHSISIQFVGDSHKLTAYYQQLYKQQNIILNLQGHDSTLKEELIILGAHYDTFSDETTDPAGKFPGADDNASGCAVLLEALRLLVKSGILLNHTVEFHFYTAKEIGRKGSDDVATKYEKEKVKVKGMLNFDRAGYGNKIAFVDVNQDGSRNTNGPLTAFVKTLLKEYTEAVQIEDANCRKFCRADHDRWHKMGYPAAYILEAPESPHIHTEMDTIETVNFNLVKEFTKVAVAFVIELGEPSTIASVSAAKPGLERMKMEFILIWCGLLYFLIDEWIPPSNL